MSLFTPQQLETLEEYIFALIGHAGYCQSGGPFPVKPQTLQLRGALTGRYEHHIHLLNTTIIPSLQGHRMIPLEASDGDDPSVTQNWKVEEINASKARGLVAQAVSVTSHVGHESTAGLLSTILGIPVAFDRTPWDGTGLGLAFQVKGRPPEGRIMSVGELEAMGYSLRLLWKAAS